MAPSVCVLAGPAAVVWSEQVRMDRSARQLGRIPLRVALLPGAAAVLVLIVLGSVYVSPLLSVYAAYYVGALATAILVPTLLIPRLWKAASTSLAQRIAWAFRLNAIRGGLLAASALAFVLLPLDFGSELMFKVIVFTVPTIVIAIPVMSAVGTWLVTSQPEAEVYEGDRWVGVSKLVTVVSWIGALLLFALVIWVFEYWPVSLKHGPDTPAARAGFESHFGFASPESVDDVYFRKFLFWQTDETYTKFHYRDREVVDRILAEFEMEPRSEVQTYGMIRLQFPRRWLDDEREDAFVLGEFYRAPYGHSAWVDTENQIFYYLAFLD